MRIDQYIGLNSWARKNVAGKHSVREIGVQILPGGKKRRFNRWRRVSIARIQQIGVIKGAWNPAVAQLKRYTMPDGRVFEEFVQEVPWSGGPCYHIALKDGRGNVVPESLWTEDELSAC